MIVRELFTVPYITSRSIDTTVFEPPKFSKTSTVYDILIGTVTNMIGNLFLLNMIY